MRFSQILSCKTQPESNNNQQRHEKKEHEIIYIKMEKNVQAFHLCWHVFFSRCLSHNDGTNMNMNIEHGQTDL